MRERGERERRAEEAPIATAENVNALLSICFSFFFALPLCYLAPRSLLATLPEPSGGSFLASAAKKTSGMRVCESREARTERDASSRSVDELLEPFSSCSSFLLRSRLSFFALTRSAARGDSRASVQ